MGHKYFGIELRQEEVDRIKEQQVKLDKKFDIFCGDSTNDYNFEEPFDFSYTCPPYYDLEVYSKLENDLSAKSTYDGFLNGLEKAISGVYKALKPGSLSVWVVGNFRDNQGHLRHFNGDLVRCAKKAGFSLHDELIFWGASKCASQRCGQFEANRKSVRVHEYILIFKK
jgi:DNA modification methylase